MLRLRASWCLVVIGVGALGCRQSTRADASTALDAGGAPAEAPDLRPARGDRSISGVITFSGTPPPPEPLSFAWAEDCKPLMEGVTLHDVEGEAGGLKDVFVYVLSGLPASARYPVPEQPKSISNKSCLFTPRVFGLQVDQKLELSNDDPLLHIFHAIPEKGEFSFATPKGPQKFVRTFSEAQAMVLIVCDIHPWMNSYVGVLEHPFFAVTDSRGAFHIEGLPPGKYVVEVWHRQLGSRQVTVDVESVPKGEVRVDFTDADIPPNRARRRALKRTGHLGWEKVSSP